MATKHEDRDDKKDKPKEADLSTPRPVDEDFMLWLVRLFHDNERADRLTITPRFGRTGRVVGEVLKKYEFPKDRKPSREELVELSCWLYAQMQNEVDVHHVTMKFKVEAFNDKKGADAFDNRSFEVTPKKFVLGPNGSHVGFGTGDDDDDEGNGALGIEDTLRSRASVALKDARHYNDQAITTLGGIVQVLVDRDKHKDDQIQKFMDLWITTVRQNNELANNALDREIIRNRENFNLEIKRKGFSLVAGLLPGVVSSLSKGKINMPGGRSPESMTIESVMESLNSRDKQVIFGEWVKEESGAEKCVKAGVLTETQCRIIVGVAEGEISPDGLDRLIGGPDAITKEQFQSIAEQGIDMEKLFPLAGLMKDRMDKRGTVPPAAPK